MRTKINRRKKREKPEVNNLTKIQPSKLKLTKNQIITLLASIIALLGTIINTCFLYYATINTSREIQMIEKRNYDREKIKTLLPYISQLDNIWEGFLSTWNSEGMINKKPIEFITDILSKIKMTNTVYMQVKYFLDSKEQAYFDKVSSNIGELSAKACSSLEKKNSKQEVINDDNLLELLKVGIKFKVELKEKIEELTKP